MTRRLVVLVAAALLAVAGTVGTGALSAVTADRAVTVDVADDENAYLGVALATNDTTNATANLTVSVTNQFPAGTQLTDVTVEANGEAAALATDDDPLTVGETASITVQNATCGDTVALRASGDGVTVALERSIDCE